MDKFNLWRRVWPKDVPTELTLPYGEIPIADCLKRHAKQTPDRVALFFYGREVTFREWDEAADRLAAALADMGFKKGDRAILYMYNCPQMCIAYIAAFRLGIIIFTADPGFKKIEMEYELLDSQASLVFAFDQNYHVIEQLRNKTLVKSVIITSFQDYLPDKPNLALHPIMTAPKKTFSGTLEFLDLIKKYKPQPPHVDISMEDEQLVLYTGGTTGFPKGTVHSHRNTLLSAIYNYQNSMLAHDLSNVRSTIVFTPLSHMGSLSLAFFPACVYGVSIVLFARYDPNAALKAIDHYKVEFVMATTSIYQDWISRTDLSEYDLSHVKHWMTYEFMLWLTPDLAQKWEALFGKRIVKYGYGMSEVCNIGVYGGRVGYEIPHKSEFMAGAVAYGAGVDVKIVDFDTHHELPLGNQGEIAIKSPARCKRYWNKPEESARDLTHDGWFYTGDIGKLDEEGYLYWYGRKKYLIRVSGFQVSSGEMEMIGRRCPDIKHIAVIGIPHAKKGQIPKAYVQLVRNSTATSDSIEQWFKDQVISYKVPTVEIVQNMPLTPKGSIDLKRLLSDKESFDESCKR